MAQDVTGNIYEANIIYESRERAFRTRLWYEQTDPAGTATPALALAKGIAGSDIPSALASIMSNSNRVIGVEAFLRATPVGQDLLQTENGPAGQAYISPIAGARLNGDCLPDNSCLIIRWLQTAGGSRNNGKAFISGLDQDDVTAGVLNEAARSAFQVSLVNAWPLGNLAGDPAGTFRQVVMTKPRDEFGNPQGWAHPKYGSPLDVTGVDFNAIIYTQRRRTTRFEGRA